MTLAELENAKAQSLREIAAAKVADLIADMRAQAPLG